MRVLITGAGGFVGTYLIRHLWETTPGVEIIGTIHPGLPHHPPPQDVRFVPCDIVAGGGTGITALLRQIQPDYIYHLAGMASGAAQDRDAVFHVNVDGARYLLEAARGITPARHILMAGTGYVYGDCDPSHPAREEDPLADPASLSIYAASKRAMEETVRDCGGAVISRAFNHTGPGQTTAFSVPAFAAQVAAVERGEQEDIKVGDLEARRDFLDVRDVVRAYRLLVEHGVPGEAYNVCSGAPRRMRDVLDDLRALARVPVPISPDPARMRPSDIQVSVGDFSKLAALTGWRPEISFPQTLQDTLDFWRQSSTTRP